MAEKNLVSVEVQIGGNLPASKLDSFVSITSRLYEYDPNEFSYKKGYKDRIKEVIRHNIYVAEQNHQPLIFTVYLPDGSMNSDVLMFYMANELKFFYRVAPYVDNDDMNSNEYVTIYNGHDMYTIPTDGQMSPVTRVKDVISVVNNFFNAYELDPDDDPTRINGAGIEGEVSRKRMSGEDLRKSLLDLLQDQLGYPEIKVPYFHVV